MTYQEIFESIQANGGDSTLEALAQRGIEIEHLLGLSETPLTSPTGDQHLLQDVDEFKPFCELLRSEGVRSYLEIGSWSGGSIETVANFLPTGARIVSVEQPLPPFWFVQIGARRKLVEVLYALRGRGYDARLVVGDSTEPQTVASVRALGPFDALFVDGSHAFTAVCADWKNYAPMARLIGFHDIAKDDPGNGVSEFWSLLKPGFKHVEFISETTRKRAEGGYGIGVVWR